MLNENIKRIIDGAFEAAVRSGETVSFESPRLWAERNINFRQVKSAFAEKLDLSLTPYQIDPIEYWDFSSKIREMTVVGPEQMGKTLAGWQIGLLWAFIHKHCLSMVIYPSDDKAEKINTNIIQPLMREIPKLAEELLLPRTKKADSYNFSNFVSYFQGAGARISSHSARIRVADELADWQDEQNAAPIVDDLRKRAWSFDDESMFAKVSTVKGSEGNYIWQEFLKSSQGYWHLKCLNCGRHTMRSCDVHNLQWEMKEDCIIEESIRLICPTCKHEHKESDKREINLQGKYIHLFPERVDLNAGFQWGMLASQRKTHSWLVIAGAQLEAGRSAEIKNQIFFDNSVRGLPHKQRKGTDAERNKIIQHSAPLPDPAILEGLFISADTQDDGWFWIIRGIDEKENTYKLDEGFCKTLNDLDNAKKKGWSDIPCLAGIVDEGGHKGTEVQRFVTANRGWYSYKGGSMHKERFRLSDNNTKLIWAISKQYQSDLLYYIYQQDNRDNSYWYLPPEISDAYMAHILDMRPEKGSKMGHLYENWQGSGNDHYFDCEKMMLVILDYARKYFRSEQWRLGKMRGLVKQQRVIPIVRPQNSLFGGNRPKSLF